MARQSNVNPSPSGKSPPAIEQESRGAVGLTVAWMLMCTSTAAAMAMVLLLQVVMAVWPVAAGGVHPLARIASVLLFVAMLTGVLCLVFTGLAIRIRHTPPPRAITVAAVLIGLSPLVMIIVLALLRWPR